MPLSYIALGSNLGDKKNNILEAFDHVSSLGNTSNLSDLYETIPQGFSSQPTYINAVCDLQTFLTPWDLLHKLKDIENMVGRTRSFINAPRIIDIDILIYGELNIESPGLTVPHPTMHMRYFVLKPLLDLNPFIKHPVWGGFLSRFAAKLDPTSVRECLADSTLVNKP